MFYSCSAALLCCSWTFCGNGVLQTTHNTQQTHNYVYIVLLGKTKNVCRQATRSEAKHLQKAKLVHNLKLFVMTGKNFQIISQFSKIDLEIARIFSGFFFELNLSAFKNAKKNSIKRSTTFRLCPLPKYISTRKINKK